MNEVELEAWKAFLLAVKDFLDNKKGRNYAELVNNMLTTFTNLGCNMSIKMHYLSSHMARFLENMGLMSDEQGERFHHDIKEMETRYQGCWHAIMTTDYCWTLKRDLHSRSSKKRKFKPWILKNGDATYNLRLLTFIKVHHSVYRNRCFHQVMNIVGQTFFFLKTLLRMMCWQNELIMPQKYNRFVTRFDFLNK